jgi:hypothetical protein
MPWTTVREYHGTIGTIPWAMVVVVVVGGGGGGVVVGDGTYQWFSYQVATMVVHAVHVYVPRYGIVHRTNGTQKPGTRVLFEIMLYVHTSTTSGTNGTRVPWFPGTHVPWYGHTTGTHVRTQTCPYTCSTYVRTSVHVYQLVCRFIVHIFFTPSCRNSSRISHAQGRHVDQGSGTTLGLAAEAYAAVKAAKYADQDNFIPFVLETGGRVNKAARDWFDSVP